MRRWFVAGAGSRDWGVAESGAIAAGCVCAWGLAGSRVPGCPGGGSARACLRVQARRRAAVDAVGDGDTTFVRSWTNDENVENRKRAQVHEDQEG